jgi:NAD-specific glutamate dehydrogenase
MSTPNDTHVEDWHRAVVTAMGDQPRLVDFQPQWPLAYIAEASPERAIADAVALSEVTPESPTISFVKGDSGRGRFTIVVAARPRSLAELLPPLQSLGLEVLSERPAGSTTSTSRPQRSPVTPGRANASRTRSAPSGAVRPRPTPTTSSSSPPA